MGNKPICKGNVLQTCSSKLEHDDVTDDVVMVTNDTEDAICVQSGKAQVKTRASSTSGNNCQNKPGKSDPRPSNSEVANAENPKPAVAKKKTSSSKAKSSRNKSAPTERPKDAKPEGLQAEAVRSKSVNEINDRLAKIMEDAMNGPKTIMSLVKELDKNEIVCPSDAVEGRSLKMDVPRAHYILHTQMEEPWPQNSQVVVMATGCFWGSEKGFWRLPVGIITTAVGYAAGYTKNPIYEEVCSGKTGATEAVQVVYNPSLISLSDLLRWFWESHDPTQGMGQGNDRGTQYRSGLYYFNDEQKELMEATKNAFGKKLRELGMGKITTEIQSAAEFEQKGGKVFYYAEVKHQQYLAKPGSTQYCSAVPLQVSLPPFEDWCPKHLLHHTPKLREDFWANHGPSQKGALDRQCFPIKWS